MIRAESETHYAFFAAPESHPWGALRLGQAPATIVSGGAGPFTGMYVLFPRIAYFYQADFHFLGYLVGVYATNNNGKESTKSYISGWRYTGLAQEIDSRDLVLS